MDKHQRQDTPMTTTTLNKLGHENNGLVPLDQHGAREVPANSSCQHQSLQVSAFADHVRHRIAVTDAGYVLLGFEGTD